VRPSYRHTHRLHPPPTDRLQFFPSLSTLGGGRDDEIYDPAFAGGIEGVAARIPVVWRRPEAIFGRHCQLFGSEGGSALSALRLGAGQLGDTYLLGALAALSARPALVRRLFVSTRGARHGVYTLQLWRHEQWVQVTVDSLLPCDGRTGAPLFARPRREDGFWLALVEKACAKLAGSYAALAGHGAPGRPADAPPPPTFLDALRELTGGIPVAFAARPPEMSLERLLALVQSGAPVALTRRGRAAGSPALDASSASALLPPEAGELLRGLPYPLVRVDAQRRAVCLASPWASGRHARETASAGTPANAPSRGDAFWLDFDELALHFDEVLAAEAPHDPTAADARDGSRRRLFVEGSWQARVGAPACRVAAFKLRLAAPARLTAVLCQRTAGAPPVPLALLMLPSTDPAGLEAIAGRRPLPARLISLHTLPPRPQREVVLDSITVVQPGTYHLLAYRLDVPDSSGPPPPSFCLQIEAEARRLGGANVGVDDVGAAREAWSEAPALAPVTCTPLTETQLPPSGGAGGGLSIEGNDALQALLETAAPAEPPAEDEAANMATLRALAAMTQRASSAARIQAQVRGNRERQEIDEMRQLLSERANAAASTIQDAVRASPSTRERATEAAEAAQAALEISELERLGAYLSENALRVQRIARGNSARRLVASRSQSVEPIRSGGGSPTCDIGAGGGGSAGGGGDRCGGAGGGAPAPHGAHAADATVHARLDRIEELLLRLSEQGSGALAALKQDMCVPSAAEREAAAAAIQARARGQLARGAVAAERAHARRQAEACRIQAAVRGAGARRTAREMRRRQVAEGFFTVQPFDRYAYGLLGGGSEAVADEWRYVPRHAAKAAAAAAARGGLGVVEPSVEAAAAASRLLNAPAAFGQSAPGRREADLQPVGYRSRVLELQRRQHAIVASLPLRRPERVARLMVEKDAALERLAEIHVAGRSTEQYDAIRADTADLASLFAQQRKELGAEMDRAMTEQRAEYHAAIAELAAELNRQSVPSVQLESVAQLNHELEAALERVLAIETRAARFIGPRAPRGRNGQHESQVCAIM